MKHRSATTTGWQDATPTAGPETSELDRFITDVLLAENLVIICGLGTSLCIKDNKHQRIAPTMTDLWKRVKDTSPEFSDIITSTRYPHAPEGDNIELLLSYAQMAQILMPSTNLQDFIENAEEQIASACRFNTTGLSLTTHETFLRKVARRSTRLPRAKIFTTNYDTCFEQAATNTQFIVIDGFSHTHPQEFDGTHFSYDFVRREQDNETPDYIPNVVHLYKIHGSVDWELDGHRIIKGTEPKRPLIIYPRQTKFETTYNQPFLEMISRLQIALRHPNTGLLIIGFGFNDSHIAQPVLQAIRSNIALKALIVDPDIERAITQKTILQEVDRLIQAGDFRLNLLAGGFEELVPRLPDLVATTEEERHYTRLRSANPTP